MWKAVSEVRTWVRKGAPAFLVGLLGLMALTPNLAFAQAAAPPVRSSIDENGVDLTSGSFRYSAQEVSIGQPNAGGLTYVRNFVGDGWRDNLTGTIKREQEWIYDLDGAYLADTGFYIVSFGSTSERFELFNGAFVQAEGSQSTLSFNATTQKYTYNNSGVVMVFDKALSTYAVANGVTVGGGSEHEGRIVSITYPTGEAVTFHYKTGTSGGTSPINRLQSVTNNLGYHLKFTYVRDAAPAAGAETLSWFRIASVTGINGAVDYCDPTADSCTYSVT